MPRTDDRFGPIDIRDVPLERVRDLVAAMAEHLGLRLEWKEPFYGEPEYRFVSKPPTRMSATRGISENGIG